MTYDEVVQRARFRYLGDDNIHVGNDPYDDVWEVVGGYAVRAHIFVPKDEDDDDES